MARQAQGGNIGGKLEIVGKERKYLSKSIFEQVAEQIAQHCLEDRLRHIQAAALPAKGQGRQQADLGRSAKERCQGQMVESQAQG